MFATSFIAILGPRTKSRGKIDGTLALTRAKADFIIIVMDATTKRRKATSKGGNMRLGLFLKLIQEVYKFFLQLIDSLFVMLTKCHTQCVS